MHQIVPPHSRPISRAKMLLDGVAHGKRYLPPQSPQARLFPETAVLRRRRQLDAVHIRRSVRRVWSWRFIKLHGLLAAKRLGARAKRVSRRAWQHSGFLDGSPRRALYASLVGGVSFGMVSMGMLQNFVFSDDVSAKMESASASAPAPAVAPAIPDELAANQPYDPDHDIFLEYFSQAAREEYGDQIREMVKGYPIEDMLPYILEQDRIVAAFLIGIAKKESNWGKRVPVLGGQDCFNYWGYRGVRRLMGTGGHTCFNSRKDAVETVAERLNTLIHSAKLDTPAKLIIWKCGYSCDGHSRESVRKWIADVDLYFSQLNDAEGGDAGNS